MVISRNAIARVALPEEQVEVPEIGGTVLVRGMDMPRLGRFEAARRRYVQPEDGETEQEAVERAVLELIPLALHLCVLADDGQPVYSPAEWAAFAVRHGDRVAELWRVVERLAGLDAPKNA
jgi:hypothetical protein